MDLEDIAPKRAEIQSQINNAIKNLPANAPREKIIENLHGAVRNHIRAKSPDLPEEAIEKILSDLSSYDGFPQRARAQRQF